MKLAMTISEVDMVFSHIDRNKDGNITMKEFEEFERGSVVKERMHISKMILMLGRYFDESFKNIRQAFEYFDTNGDENISKMEFVRKLS